MKLEKFKKHGIRNKKIICSVIGVILIICGVLLLKSFAFFESKYDFNVIKGRIPNFTVGDVTLAFTVDGVKSGDAFPNKKDGYAVTSVTCANGVTAEWNNDLWGLVNVNSNGNKKISCNIDFKTVTLYDVVKLGDYVSYTPSKTSYTIQKILTGYSSDQKINPSELDLWRVIKKNEDGTIEMVSEYVSSTVVNFYGRTGYANYVGALKTIAQQYEIEGITSGSRYMGYDGQTEYITDSNTLDNAYKTWPTNTSLENSYKGSERERRGGGDWLYITDTNLVTAAIGNLKAQTKKQKGTTVYSNYFVSSRFVWSNNSTFLNVSCRYILGDGTFGHSPVRVFYQNGSFSDYNVGFNLRVIVKLNNNQIFLDGNGSDSLPYKIN